MQFQEGAAVYDARDEKAGHIDRVVIDPRTHEITHIVVRKGFLFTEDKLLPVTMVDRTTEDRVTLNVDKSKLDTLPNYEDTEYIPLDPADFPDAQLEPYNTGFAMPLYWYPTFGAGYPGPLLPPAAPPYVVDTEKNTPKGTIALREGAAVRSSNGDDVGRIERIFTHEDKVSHFLISQGMIFKEKKVIPSGWVTNITDEEVQLAVPTSVLKRLPAYET